MTLNQIAYWSLLETNRHNIQAEKAALISAYASASHASAAHRQAAVAERQIGISEFLAPYQAMKYDYEALNLMSQSNERDLLKYADYYTKLSQIPKNTSNTVLGVSVPGTGTAIMNDWANFISREFGNRTSKSDVTPYYNQFEGE